MQGCTALTYCERAGLYYLHVRRLGLCYTSVGTSYPDIGGACARIFFPRHVLAEPMVVRTLRVLAMY